MAETFNPNLDPLDEHVLHSWKSPERVFRGANKELYSTIIILATLISIILFFIEGFMPVLVVWAMVFAFWALSKTPPLESTHQLTTWGIRTGATLYRFSEMKVFWFDKQESHVLLRALITKFPGQILLIINPNDESLLKRHISEAGVHYEIPPQNILDKTSQWFQKRIK